MAKLYGVHVFKGDVCLIAFTATLDKARLRSHIHRLQGYATTRPVYMPRMTERVAAMVARGQVVAPALRD
jgi:hypothetical protein